MTINYNMNGGANSEHATFITAYEGQGITYKEYSGLITISHADMVGALSRSLNQGVNPRGLTDMLRGRGAVVIAPPANEVEVTDSSRVDDEHDMCLETICSGDEPVEEPVDKSGLVYFNLRAMVSTTVHNILDSLFQAYKHVDKPREGVWSIEIHHFFINDSGNMDVVQHYRDSNSFDHLNLEMYPRINIGEMMKMYSESNESNIILTGAPGTGKTCFAKLMMAFHARNREENLDVIYAKDPELLAKDSFWARVSSINPEFLILDDLDDELKPRTEGSNPIINNLLSFSDGIFEVDTKIVITTNQPNTAIDPAVIRPGRCFDILALPNLNREEALAAWIKLGADEESYDLRLGDVDVVSQALLMSEHARHLKSAAPTYLYDQSISIRRSVEAGNSANS